MIAYITKKVKKNLHFCDWSTLSLIFLHIIYSFPIPSFEFQTNSESDQLHFHTKIIFFFFPLFTYFLFCFISHCLFFSHLCLLLKSQSTRNLELNFCFLLTVPPPPRPHSWDNILQLVPSLFFKKKNL